MVVLNLPARIERAANSPPPPPGDFPSFFFFFESFHFPDLSNADECRYEFLNNANELLCATEFELAAKKKQADMSWRMVTYFILIFAEGGMALGKIPTPRILEHNPIRQKMSVRLKTKPLSRSLCARSFSSFRSLKQNINLSFFSFKKGGGGAPPWN